MIEHPGETGDDVGELVQAGSSRLWRRLRHHHPRSLTRPLGLRSCHRTRVSASNPRHFDVASGVLKRLRLSRYGRSEALAVL